MSDEIRSQDREVIILKLKTLEPLIQRVESKIAELRINLAKVYVLHPEDPVAQSRFISQQSADVYEQATGHSLIDEDLDRVESGLGEDFKNAKKQALDWVTCWHVMAILSMIRPEDEQELAKAHLGFLHGTISFMRIGIHPHLRLRRELFEQLGRPPHRSVKVDLKRSCITVNGVEYPVALPKATFVSLLLEKQGSVVPSTELNKHPQLQGVRLDRLRKEILEKDRVPLTIKSKRGAGYMIPVA
jgi:hypothetical protein